MLLPMHGEKIANASEIVDASTETTISPEYVAYCETIGEQYQLSPELLQSIIEKESNGNPEALGKDGDSGLMQIIPKWHQERMEKLKIHDIFEPYGNIMVGADYIFELAMKYYDLPLVLMIYNGIPLEEAFDRNQRGDFTEYANWIMKRTQELEREHEI